MLDLYDKIDYKFTTIILTIIHKKNLGRKKKYYSE